MFNYNLKFQDNITKMTEETCAICLEILNDNVYTIPECNHKFHNNCMIEWYRRLGSDCGCPLCRSSPDLTSLSTSKARVKLYKQISRRKVCPIIIKKLCIRHTKCNKDAIPFRKNLAQFRKIHKKIFAEADKLREKIWRNSRKKYKISQELDSLPILLLLKQIS